MRGGAPSAQALKELKAAGVKTIVNLRGEGGASKKEERTAKEIGLDYYNIPMGYTEPNLAKVSSVLDIMRDPAKQPVYLHCMHGADRTGMMVGINRILSDGWQFDKVYSEMRGHHFKPFLIPMRRTVQAFANGKYTYVERQGVSIAGVSPKSSSAKMAAEKPL
jgi:protein tyrosine/serine phosphatase